MQQACDCDPFSMGAQAFLDGVDPVEGNPFDAGEQPHEWDEWEDGWATRRLEVFKPWMQQVEAKIGRCTRRFANFDRCFDEGMTPEEAIEENRIEIEKQEILNSQRGP